MINPPFAERNAVAQRRCIDCRIQKPVQEKCRSRFSAVEADFDEPH
jgi:hypothetical protein